MTRVSGPQSSPPVLLVLTTTKPGIHAETEALREALTRKTSLRVLFVLDPKMASPKNLKILSGIIGPAAAKPLGREILRDYESRANSRFEEIRADCEEIGIPFDARICRGPFLDEVRACVQACRPAVAILPKRPKSFLSRFFLQDELALLQSTAPQTQVRIIEEDI
ncbi:hypothetical protein HY522_09095 [bacterium]|nr:hypothetical protein [bacterium]